MQALGVERSATAEQIRRAYHRLALRLHPDKNPGDAHVRRSPRPPPPLPPPAPPPQAAKENFQSLQQVFAVLGDAERRRVYDQTGSLDDAELSGAAFDSLYEFYRNVFKKVSADDIVAFEAEYRGSAEETADLKQLYRRFKGNMAMVMAWMLCSRDADCHRFVTILNAAVAEGELPITPPSHARLCTACELPERKTYRRWAQRVAERGPPLESPLKPAARRDGNGGSQGDLAALIRSRQGQRGEELVAALAAKYGKTEGKREGKRRGGAAAHEPSEEDFVLAHKRVMAHRGVAKPKK
eukprot:SM000082S22844  [mRNA]  locus=s82:270035:271593:- [translate_table: standard]